MEIKLAKRINLNFRNLIPNDIFIRVLNLASLLGKYSYSKVQIAPFQNQSDDVTAFELAGVCFTTLSIFSRHERY